MPGALFLCAGFRGQGEKYEDETAVPMVEGDAEGGGGGDLTGGPLDGQTNRGSNPRRRRAPPVAHTTRPSMPLTLYGTRMVQKGRTSIGGSNLTSPYHRGRGSSARE